jgi:hypothetical protein
MDRFNVTKINHRNPVVIPGYKFEKDITLFSAIILADLKQNGDRKSLFKVNNLLRSPGALLRLVSKTFRPFVGNDVHLSNDLDAVQPWCELYKKNVLIYTFDKDSRTLNKEFDSDTRFEDTPELLKTTEYRDDYHVLVDKQRFITAVETIIHPVKKEPIGRLTQKRQIENEKVDAFVASVKEQFSKKPKVVSEVEPVDPEGHFKPSIPWHLLNSTQKDHLHNCPKCAFPYYNNLPEEECLLTIHSYLQDKDLKVSPYQYLHVTSENFRLGVRSVASKNNLYYLNHVEKKRKESKNNGDTFLQFANAVIDAARLIDTPERMSTKDKIEAFFNRSNTCCS